MSILKCKMCGGDLEVKQGSSLAVCTYCGTQQTILTESNERKTKLFNRAHELRLNNDFDQAMGIFESIISEYPNEAEAYWGRCLCKYGIEYVDDYATKTKVPTCHRTSYDSILNDNNYHKAVELAPIEARDLYFNEALQIDKIQRNILSIARSERPYDIFICYKETDNRQRTVDSVLAQNIYDALVEQGGYKVFFSRITLEDKLGEEFEPYIFSALNTAKVMLVVGTSNINMNSVWVKNEWSRYLELMKEDKGKLLIPCYSDMDAYDLPEEFRNLQAQDMNKIGFMQDLIRGIKKVVSPTMAKSSGINAPGAVTDIKALLKRIENFVEDNNWTSADDYCERVLDIDPDNAQAYLYKLLIDKRVASVEELKNCADSFENNINYNRLVKLADEKLKLKLKGYIEYIQEKKNKARVAREKAEQQRLIHEKEQRDIRRKRILRYTTIGTVLTITIVAVTMGYIYLYKPWKINMDKYQYAMSLFEKGDLVQAAERFEEIQGFKDSSDVAQKALNLIEEEKLNRYNEACALLDQEEYDKAINLFNEMDGYKDSSELILESKYRKAKKGYLNGDRHESIAIFMELEDYKDTQEILRENKYEILAVELNNCNDADEIKRLIKDIKIYNKKDIDNFQNLKNSLMNNQNYDSYKEYIDAIDNYIIYYSKYLGIYVRRDNNDEKMKSYISMNGFAGTNDGGVFTKGLKAVHHVLSTEEYVLSDGTIIETREAMWGDSSVTYIWERTAIEQ